MNSTSTIQRRREAKRTLDRLSTRRLEVAADFLSYLEERDTNPATEELLRIPGFLKALRKAQREIAQGRVTPVEKLVRSY